MFVSFDIDLQNRDNRKKKKKKKKQGFRRKRGEKGTQGFFRFHYLLQKRSIRRKRAIAVLFFHCCRRKRAIRRRYQERAIPQTLQTFTAFGRHSTTCVSWIQKRGERGKCWNPRSGLNRNESDDGLCWCCVDGMIFDLDSSFFFN